MHYTNEDSLRNYNLILVQQWLIIACDIKVPGMQTGLHHSKVIKSYWRYH